MGKKAIDVRHLALKAYNLTKSSKSRQDHIDDVGHRINYLLSFVYGYTSISDPSIDTDDEIINWTFVDVADDLNAANWSIACGFYKAAASSMRNAIDIAAAALYFQLRENSKTERGSYNKYFAEWDSGQRDTPNWGEMKDIMNNCLSLKAFNKQYSCDIFEELHAHFKYLCNFTHGRPYDKVNLSPTNSINLECDTPEFDATVFPRFNILALDTIAWIATIWLVAFPAIITGDPLDDKGSKKTYESLLSHQRARDALAYSLSRTSI
jgi:hypothetical protein